MQCLMVLLAVSSSGMASGARILKLSGNLLSWTGSDCTWASASQRASLSQAWCLASFRFCDPSREHLGTLKFQSDN